MRSSDKTLHGRAVISADGKVIGSIVELFISTSEWRVESIRIELRKDIADRIGASRTVFHRGTLEVPTAFIQSVSDTVVLAVDVDQLREVHRRPAAGALEQDRGEQNGDGEHATVSRDSDVSKAQVAGHDSTQPG